MTLSQQTRSFRQLLVTLKVTLKVTLLAVGGGVLTLPSQPLRAEMPGVEEPNGSVRLMPLQQNAETSGTDNSPPRWVTHAVEDTLPPQNHPRATVQLMWGPYWPSGSAMSQVYEGPHYRIGALGRYELVPDVSVAVGIAYLKHDGTAVGKVSGTVSEEIVTFKSFPLELGATYRPSRFAIGSVAPYVNAGLDLHPYTESVGESSYSGGKWGFHARLGADITLEPPAPSWTSDSRSGLQSTALLIELGYNQINNFGAGALDLSGLSLQVGFGLGF